MSQQLELDETDRQHQAAEVDPVSGREAPGPSRPPIGRRAAALLMAGLALAGLLAGLMINLVNPPTWTATSTVLVQWRPADVVTLLLTGTAENISAEDLGDVAGLLGSPEVLGQVARQLPDQPTVDELAGDLTATAVASSHLVTVEATAETRAGAVLLAQVASSVLAAEQQAEVTEATADLPAGDLTTRGQVVADQVQPVRVLGEARAEQTSPTLRTPLALAVVGFALGGLLVIALSLRGRDLRPRRA